MFDVLQKLLCAAVGSKSLKKLKLFSQVEAFGDDLCGLSRSQVRTGENPIKRKLKAFHGLGDFPKLALPFWR